MKLQECFPTPLWTDSLDQINNDQIKTFAYDLKSVFSEKRDANRYRKNPTALKWRSYYLIKQELEKCEELIKVINQTESRVKQCFQDFSPNKTVSIRFENCWFNINSYGTYTGPHVHPSSCIIATYYVSAPDGCGNIIFMNPNQSIYWNFPSGAYSERTRYTDGLISVPVKSCGLVIAPAHFQHYVEPSESMEDRISFTMNFVMCNQNYHPNDRNFLR